MKEKAPIIAFSFAAVLTVVVIAVGWMLMQGK